MRGSLVCNRRASLVRCSEWLGVNHTVFGLTLLKMKGHSSPPYPIVVGLSNTMSYFIGLICLIQFSSQLQNIRVRCWASAVAKKS